MTNPCIECLRGLPCLNAEPCERASNDDDGINRTTDTEESEETHWRFANTSGKRDSALKDQQSTGRKRAAKLYPLDRSATCEWREASSENRMGGGDNPIPFGCVNLQQARHHGPDKNTLNNEPGNVHRICHFHHNNWHALNDKDYDWANSGKNVRD